jgi:hypothetical protein
MRRKRPLRLGLEGTRHEGHGRCSRCQSAVHQYPYGWEHVHRGELTNGRACSKDARCIVVTCCAAHEPVPDSEHEPESPLGGTG